MRLDISKKIILLLVLVTGFVWIIFFAGIKTSVLSTKAVDECLACHEDKDLTMDVKGKKKSLFIDKKKFENAVHAGADCKDCHEGYNADELPHSKNKINIDCKSCHSDVKSGPHDSHLKVDCASCHNPHYSSPAKEIKNNLTNFCTNCHNEKHITIFKTSVHAKKNVECSDCHKTGHDIKKITKTEIINTCNKCHQKAHEKIGNILNVSMLQNGNPNAPVCTDCHGTHQVSSNKISIQSNACLKCHLDASKFPGTEKGSADFVKQYKTSVHGLARDKNGNEAAGCTDCHGNHELDDPKNPSNATMKANLMGTCGKCHADEVGKFKNSAHGRAYLSSKNENAPSCTKCHGEHNISSIASNEKFTKIKQTDLCLDCHKSGKVTGMKNDSDSLAGNYHASSHYIALKDGNSNSASCADCHGAHEMNTSVDPISKTNKKNIANTCGVTNCHPKESDEYKGSIHQVAINNFDNKDAPTCINCHGNHQIIKRDKNLDKNIASKNVIKLCSDCHASTGIIQRNELKDVTGTFNESFHGLAVRGGSGEAANCESCHGYHNVRSPKDSLSSTFSANLSKTCGKCHKVADKSLFETKIHIVNPKIESPWLYWITNFYIILIIGTIGAMTLHNILDYRKKIKLKRAEQKEKNSELNPVDYSDKSEDDGKD
jgi:predicted CXXCH cytochrome family protein